MRIVTGKAAAISSGKAHPVCDFQTDPDVTRIRITNLSAEHALEIFTEEEAVAGTDSHTIASGGTHFLEVPYSGGTIFGAGVGGEIDFEVIGVVAEAGSGITTG